VKNGMAETVWLDSKGTIDVIRWIRIESVFRTQLRFLPEKYLPAG
jgi:hypothetical protein